MKFGEWTLDEAEGGLLAHTHRLASGAVKKGTRLGPSELSALRAEGVETVFAALAEPGDVLEDLAAERLARACAGPGIEVLPPAAGRSNLKATRRGLLEFDRARLDAFNAQDWRLTLATPQPFALCEVRERVATVKVIPFAVEEEAVRRAEEALAEPGPLLRLAAFRPHQVGLVLSYASEREHPWLDKAAEVQRARVAYLASSIRHEDRCRHDVQGVAAALERTLESGAELVLFMGASAIADLHDVFPLALKRIGGQIEHVGMPVEPGNLLVLGRYQDRPVLCVPGCARSLKPSGFDWVLQRLLADLPLGPAEITALGCGGLLGHGPFSRASDPSRGAPSPTAAAVVLAAGSSRRMGEVNKLLAEIEGVPMVRRAVERVVAAGYAPVVVVTGHQATEVRAALAGCPVRFAHNPAHEQGMGGSLAAGVAALEDEVPLLVALGDMPDVTVSHLEQLQQAFARGGASVVAPTFNGRRGNPVLFAAEHLPALRACTGDQGAKAVVQAAGETLRLVEVDDAGVHQDLDTPEALAARQAEATP